MNRLPLILVICACLCASVGCAHHAKRETKQEATASGGWARSQDGVSIVRRAVEHLRNTPLTVSQTGYMDEVDNGVKLIEQGNAEAKKPCDDAMKENDRSRQPFYNRLDWISTIAGVAFAVGLGVVAMAIFSPVDKKIIGLGIGLACIGGSGVAVFMALHDVAKAMTWVVPTVCVAVLGAVGYFVWERIAARRERLKKEAEAERLAAEKAQAEAERLRVEAESAMVKNAFVEVVATGEKLVQDPTVPNDAIKKAAAVTQSPTTTALVQEVKAQLPADPTTADTPTS